MHHVLVQKTPARSEGMIPRRNLALLLPAFLHHVPDAGGSISPRGRYHIHRRRRGGWPRENTRARSYGAGALGVRRSDHASQ